MRIETLSIACPTCKVGVIEVPAMVSTNVQGVEQVQVHQVRDPRKCPSCGQYAVLVPRVSFTAITLEQAKKEGRHVA